MLRCGLVSSGSDQVPTPVPLGGGVPNKKKEGGKMRSKKKRLLKGVIQGMWKIKKQTDANGNKTSQIRKWGKTRRHRKGGKQKERVEKGVRRKKRCWDWKGFCSSCMDIKKRTIKTPRSPNSKKYKPRGSGGDPSERGSKSKTKNQGLLCQPDPTEKCVRKRTGCTSKGREFPRRGGMKDNTNQWGGSIGLQGGDKKENTRLGECGKTGNRQTC